MNTKTLNTEIELNDHQLKLLNMKRIFEARQALYEPLYYSIETLNMDAYRALRKVQEELDEIEKLIEMAGE